MGTGLNLKPNQIIFASGNENKAEHFRDLFKYYNAGVEIVTLAEAGIKIDIDEKYADLLLNAEQKAHTVWREILTPTLADDSGLFIESLGGWPGVKTRRCAEDGKQSDEILKRLGDADMSRRKAAYVSAIVFMDKDGYYRMATVARAGYIAYSSKGSNGNFVEKLFIPEIYVMSHEGENPRNFPTLGCDELKYERFMSQHFDIAKVVSNPNETEAESMTMLDLIKKDVLSSDEPRPSIAHFKYAEGGYKWLSGYQCSKL